MRSAQKSDRDHLLTRRPISPRLTPSKTQQLNGNRPQVHHDLCLSLDGQAAIDRPASRKLADEKTESISDQRAIYFSILEKFPGTHEAEIAAMRLAKLDQEKWESLVDPVEAPTDPHMVIFEFAFKDAISEMVTSANLHDVPVIDSGRLVPPCVAAMPRMKCSTANARTRDRLRRRQP